LPHPFQLRPRAGNTSQGCCKSASLPRVWKHGFAGGSA
jgi:hypothetical protein